MAFSAEPHQVGVPFDLQQFIDQKISVGQKVVVVPPGTYRVTPHDRQHLALRHLSDVKIIADGVEMICTETTRALSVEDCTNVTVRGLAIDYDPLPFTQGRITGFGPGKKSHEIELFDGYPPAESAVNFKYEIFRADTRTLRCSDRYVKSIEVIDSRHLHLITPGEDANSPEQIGDLVVIGSEYAPHGSAAHAVALENDVNVRLDNINLYAANCFGFIEHNCDGTTYYQCRIDRRSPANDLVKRANPRLRSLDADAYHSSDAIKGPSYIRCTARFMGDDCINIHGEYHMIVSAHDHDLRVTARNRLNIQPGDPVELVLYDGQRLPDAKVTSVEPSGSVSDGEWAFISHQSLADHDPPRNVYHVTIDRDVTMPIGGVICSANRMGNDFTVQGCDFGYNRSRGILIKASHGKILDNHLEGCEMSSILVSPEYYWMEAGSSSDVIIAGNQISRCHGIPILVEATGGNGAIAPAGAHQNIEIARNRITDSDMPGILVTSTSRLKIESNQLELQKNPQHFPGQMRKAGLTELEPVVQINCAP